RSSGRDDGGAGDRCRDRGAAHRRWRITLCQARIRRTVGPVRGRDRHRGVPGGRHPRDPAPRRSVGFGIAMRIDVVTIFPAYLDPLRQSLPGKAIESGLIELGVHDLRHWTRDVHRSVDDSPYGGGPGMVMRAPVWGEVLDEICSDETLLIVPTPAGRLFGHADAQRWSTEKHLVF